MPASAAEPTSVIAIAGAGPVGQALGGALTACGIPIAYVGSRTRDHAEDAATFIGRGAVPIRYDEIRMYASHVIVAVSDRAIAPVAEEIASANGTVRVALHTCGSYGPEVLAPLKAVGVSCGGMHPLQTLRDPATGVAALREAAFAVCGDSEALGWAEMLASILSGNMIHIGSDSRPLYHAAAVMASNYMIALLDSAEHLMELAGVSRSDARRALAPIVRASVDNAFDLGPVEALTGPVVRGDAATVASHLQALQVAESSTVDLYRSAGLHALDMARRRGLGDQESRNVQQALLGRE